MDDFGEWGDEASKRLPNGEDVCEIMNPDRTDKTYCLEIGCCSFNIDPEDLGGYGKCWSRVGNGLCFSGQRPTTGEDQTVYIVFPWPVLCLSV